MNPRSFLIATILVGALPIFALAQDRGWPGPQRGATSATGSGQASPGAPAASCPKLCPNDFSPCDPIYFKTEDGRCAGVFLR